MLDDLSENIIINIDKIDNIDNIDKIDKIDNLDINICYICYHYCDITSPCDCKTLYIHNECQKMLIKKTKKTDCTICKTQYTNLNVKTRTIYWISDYGKLFILKIIIFIIFFGCFVCEILLSLIQNVYTLHYTIIISLPLSVVFILILKDIQIIYKNNILIIIKKDIKKIREIKEIINK